MPLQLNGPISVSDIITEFDSRLPEEISNDFKLWDETI